MEMKIQQNPYLRIFGRCRAILARFNHADDAVCLLVSVSIRTADGKLS